MDISKLDKITKEVLELETLEARNSDSLDFHEFSVWRIKAALEEAYKMGLTAGLKGFIGITVANDGKALGNLLQNFCQKPDHVGNFVFEAKTKEGQTISIFTEPVDEDAEEIKIINIRY